MFIIYILASDYQAKWTFSINYSQVQKGTCFWGMNEEDILDGIGYKLF